MNGFGTKVLNIHIFIKMHFGIYYTIFQKDRHLIFLAILFRKTYFYHSKAFLTCLHPLLCSLITILNKHMTSSPSHYRHMPYISTLFFFKSKCLRKSFVLYIQSMANAICLCSKLTIGMSNGIAMVSMLDFHTL